MWYIIIFFMSKRSCFIRCDIWSYIAKTYLFFASHFNLVLYELEVRYYHFRRARVPLYFNHSCHIFPKTAREDAKISLSAFAVEQSLYIQSIRLNRLLITILLSLFESSSHRKLQRWCYGWKWVQGWERALLRDVDGFWGCKLFGWDIMNNIGMDFSKLYLIPMNTQNIVRPTSQNRLSPLNSQPTTHPKCMFYFLTPALQLY